jgi:hypothetical protein
MAGMPQSKKSRSPAAAAAAVVAAVVVFDVCIAERRARGGGGKPMAYIIDVDEKETFTTTQKKGFAPKFFLLTLNFRSFMSGGISMKKKDDLCEQVEYAK